MALHYCGWPPGHSWPLEWKTLVTFEKHMFISPTVCRYSQQQEQQGGDAAPEEDRSECTSSPKWGGHLQHIRGRLGGGPWRRWIRVPALHPDQAAHRARRQSHSRGMKSYDIAQTSPGDLQMYMFRKQTKLLHEYHFKPYRWTWRIILHQIKWFSYTLTRHYLNPPQFRLCWWSLFSLPQKYFVFQFQNISTIVFSSLYCPWVSWENREVTEAQGQFFSSIKNFSDVLHAPKSCSI